MSIAIAQLGTKVAPEATSTPNASHGDAFAAVLARVDEGAESDAPPQEHEPEPEPAGVESREPATSDLQLSTNAADRAAAAPSLDEIDPERDVDTSAVATPDAIECAEPPIAIATGPHELLPADDVATPEPGDEDEDTETTTAAEGALPEPPGGAPHRHELALAAYRRAGAATTRAEPSAIVGVPTFRDLPPPPAPERTATPTIAAGDANVAAVAPGTQSVGAPTITPSIDRNDADVLSGAAAAPSGNEATALPDTPSIAPSDALAPAAEPATSPELAPPSRAQSPSPSTTGSVDARPSTPVSDAAVTLSRAEDLATAIERMRPIPKGGALIEVEAPGLGTMRVAVSLEDGAVKIRIESGDPRASAWLEHEQRGLAAAARQAAPEATSVELELRQRQGDGAGQHGDARQRAHEQSSARAEGRAPGAPARASTAESPAAPTARRGLVDVLA